MIHKTIANKINCDIETGVYDDYKWLRRRLQQIANKLFVINSSITHNDKELLRENDYITYYDRI